MCTAVSLHRMRSVSLPVKGLRRRSPDKAPTGSLLRGYRKGSDLSRFPAGIPPDETLPPTQNEGGVDRAPGLIGSGAGDWGHRIEGVGRHRDWAMRERELSAKKSLQDLSHEPLDNTAEALQHQPATSSDDDPTDQGAPTRRRVLLVELGLEGSLLLGIR